MKNAYANRLIERALKERVFNLHCYLIRVLEMAINLDDYGGYQPFKWTHEYLVAYLVSGKHKLIRQPLLKHAFSQIRREDFVPDELREFAYEDRELDIGFGEVINKPTVVAQMLSLLKPRFNGTYLEIGTGSGWSAALLALAIGESGTVYTIERVQFLVDIARINLSKYPGIKNIQVIFKDGSKGLPERAPFDGIIVGAAYKQVPKELMQQLKIGGRLVIPTGNNEVKVLERLREDEYQEAKMRGFFFKEIASDIE